MERRTFLRWAIHGMGAVFAVVLGVPAVIYLIDPRNRAGRNTGFRPVARLSELPEGTPKEVVIRETRLDAWTLHPDDVVGRIWLVRRGRDVQAFNTMCPHLGCSINFTGVEFRCPCHGASFALTGARQPGSVAPRGMDTLDVELERIAGTPDADPDFLIKVKYQKFKTQVGTKEVDA
jgi:menaquinol-cytochrome c reductase iron-sulfur subunit